MTVDSLRFVSLYAPNTNPSRNAFFSSLPDFIDLAVPTFICGDFNAVLDPDLDRRRHPSYAGPSQSGTYRESVAALNSLLAATQTFPVWRTRHPRDTTFSWDHPSGSFSSRIDMIWAPGWAIKCIKKAIWGFFWSGRKELVARRTVCLPKAQGGFCVVDFELKAKAFCLQWVKRYFSLTPAKWKAFFSFFCLSCLSVTPVQALSEDRFPRNLIDLLPPYYQQLFHAWFQFDGGAVNSILSLDVSSAKPRPLAQITAHSSYVIGRHLITPDPHCVGKFLPIYGTLHWPETWDQIHMTTLDRAVVDVNWKIAHGVLYTASRLVNSFGMASIDPQCHCRADEETLEHLFFECRYSRILVGWVYFNLMMYDATATPFSVDKLLFGFSRERRKRIPNVIVWMLLVVKHHLWLARNDFRFWGKLRTEAECLKAIIARIKFLLKVLAGRCRSPSQIRLFEKQWLANQTLGHFEGEKLVFSF